MCNSTVTRDVNDNYPCRFSEVISRNNIYRFLTFLLLFTSLLPSIDCQVGHICMVRGEFNTRLFPLHHNRPIDFDSRGVNPYYMKDSLFFMPRLYGLKHIYCLAHSLNHQICLPSSQLYDTPQSFLSTYDKTLYDSLHEELSSVCVCMIYYIILHLVRAYCYSKT